jgi:hypothetical protein
MAQGSKSSKTRGTKLKVLSPRAQRPEGLGGLKAQGPGSSETQRLGAKGPKGLKASGDLKELRGKGSKLKGFGTCWTKTVRFFSC